MVACPAIAQLRRNDAFRYLVDHSVSTDQAQTPESGFQPSSGFLTLASTVISVLTMLVGAFLIQPRLVERRALVDDQHILTVAEVKALPEGVLAVVLDRSQGQDQSDFRYQLLKLVMERSGRPYSIGLSEQTISQDEAIAALDQPGLNQSRNPMAISVGLYGAGLELNRRLQPVPIPVTGGILGLRAGWTHRDEVERMASVRSLNDLRDIVLLQGLGWSDVDVFDASGMRTFTARSDDLFRLVDNRRVHLFPRGIAELERDALIVRDTAASTQLDPHLLVAYPFAGFFYVSRSNPALADAIQLGFERAIDDGSYQELVERLILTPWLRRHLQLANRSVVVLPNPVAASVLADVDPTHWIVPWGDLLQGKISSGSELCATPSLRVLCAG